MLEQKFQLHLRRHSQHCRSRTCPVQGMFGSRYNLYAVEAFTQALLLSCALALWTSTLTTELAKGHGTRDGNGRSRAQGTYGYRAGKTGLDPSHGHKDRDGVRGQRTPHPQDSNLELAGWRVPALCLRGASLHLLQLSFQLILLCLLEQGRLRVRDDDQRA